MPSECCVARGSSTMFVSCRSRSARSSNREGLRGHRAFCSARFGRRALMIRHIADVAAPSPCADELAARGSTEEGSVTSLSRPHGSSPPPCCRAASEREPRGRSRLRCDVSFLAEDRECSRGLLHQSARCTDAHYRTEKCDSLRRPRGPDRGPRSFTKPSTGSHVGWRLEECSPFGGAAKTPKPESSSCDLEM